MSDSIWVIIGPAMIAALAGLISGVGAALIASHSSREALEHSSKDSVAERAHQRAMLVFDRRLLAIETIWQRIFEIERSGALSDEAQIEIVRAVVWLPEDAKYEVLSALKGSQEGRERKEMASEFRAVRETLEQLTERYEEART